METIFRKCDKNNIDMSVISEAAEIIKNGGLVGFPTETVYGLGANGLDEDAAAKIYAAKGRPSDNPLILHISDEKELDDIVEYVPDMAVKLMDRFWPGPMTLVFKKKCTVPDGTTGGLSTVAVRMPEHEVALRLIEASGVPIAAPSANISGRPSPTKAEHVWEDMQGKIDMIIDGGQVEIGLESTIIDVTGEEPVILRPGYITSDMVKDIIGTVEYDKVVLAVKKDDIDENYKPKAPGMKYRHYAPKADFVMYSGSQEAVTSRINAEIAEDVSNGLKVGIIATDETKDIYMKEAYVISLGSRDDEDMVAHNMYAALRDFDSKGVDKIYGETFDRSGLGQAIMNRLAKSAGYMIIEV
ncbi:MAG: threonylcarbamoyl-AMP synthase [Lachnospiraceae bacterium]|nr:threonylcarbamoyl-AMP synthase [Lachnospiraceae bacterium]